MPANVVVKVLYHRIKVYINDILHCHIDTTGGVHVHVWEDNNLYCIEYTTKCGTVLCDYENKEMWLNIVKEIQTKLE
jgi:hypothetical protein